VLVGTAAYFTVDGASIAGSLGFVESFLDVVALKKLHVKMLGEQEADVI